MQSVQSFYAPISAGSMAHTGAMPQSNVQYHIIAPVNSGIMSHSTGIQTSAPVAKSGAIRVGMIGDNGAIIVRGSPMPQPTVGPQGYMPPSVNTIFHAVGPAKPVNWFNSPHS